MKNKTMKFKLLLLASIVCIGGSSATIAFIPLGSFSETPKQLSVAYTIGAVFWIGTLIGYGLFIILNLMRKKASETIKPRYPKKIGIISFFRTFYGMIADVICGTSLITAIVLVLTTGKDAGLATYISISVFVFSAQMHSILNGENFRYILYLETRGNKNGKN